VTNAQYAEFLNVVDPKGSNSRGLYDSQMSNPLYGGIEKTGTTDGAHYVLRADRARKPVDYVTFFNAMRFVNWLHNGQGTGDTEAGVYTIGDGINEVRSPNARYWIPSEDEWCKAAYHDASAGTAAIYFDYATSSNVAPLSDQPWDNPAAANYYNYDGLENGFNDGFAVSGTWDYRILSTNPLTDVGAYTEAKSPYGTFDQNGNVNEWTEAVEAVSHPRINDLRGWRGGSFNYDGFSNGLRLQDRRLVTLNSAYATGLRVATIPEPTALALAATLFSGLGFVRRRA
jgi:sulfatase modifying factor 1